MSLLSRHVNELVSEEFVLGVSTGFKGDVGSRFEGIESTKITIVSTPSSKNWTGYVAIDQTVADAKVGEQMASKSFPARCNVFYRRVASTEKKTIDGNTTTKDVEKLVVFKIEYLAQVDLVDVKVAKAA
ncbi:MAG: hypothetical protein WCN27_02845 [Alphaproteobacteria bacterium]